MEWQRGESEREEKTSGADTKDGQEKIGGRWIGWFTNEVESQRTRLDELQRLADEAKRDVEPYNQ